MFEWTEVRSGKASKIVLALAKDITSSWDIGETVRSTGDEILQHMVYLKELRYTHSAARQHHLVCATGPPKSSENMVGHRGDSLTSP